MRATARIIFVLSVLMLSSCVQKKESESAQEEKPAILPELAYVHEDGSICHAQSPINILSFKDTTNIGHNITLNFKDEVNEVENLGHTVQVDFKPGSTITVDDETFDFVQAHFHTPSEHLVDGITYPMEMHVVNTLHGQPEGEEKEFLVIGFLFKMGEKNAFIEEVLNAVPEHEDESKKVGLGEVKVTDLLMEKNQAPLSHYYHYKGSLTTPPYSETVRWYVTKSILEASPEQVKRILKIEGSNARHIQALNEREIEVE
ncbi:carbonic anhydrase family protein [Flagellimonas sp.]|uniref:carbonic anhydrase family protein n=1 Tax=Flagellimonas sp. TaxID=2058762 RepID=UPI003F49CD73